MQVCVVSKRELGRLVDQLRETCGADEDIVAAEALLGDATGPRIIIDRSLLWKLSEAAAAVLGNLQPIDGYGWRRGTIVGEADVATQTSG